MTNEFILNLSITSPLVIALVKALRTAFMLDSRFLPLLSILLGIAIGLILGGIIGPSLLYGAFYGAIAGSSATGTYSAINETSKVIAKK